MENRTFVWSILSSAPHNRGVHMPKWLPESQLESATFFPGIPVESATFVFSGIPGIPGNPGNPRFFFLWNPGILETWNPGILESRNLGIPESQNPVAVFWNPCRVTKLLSFGYQIKRSKVNFHHRNRIAILKVNFCCGNQYNRISYVGMFHKIWGKSTVANSSCYNY